PVADSFLTHDAYRFQLRANPTMRRNADRRRLGIYGEDRLREWMKRKADQHGFEILADSLVVGAPIDETFVRDRKRGKHVAVDFGGMLEVRDRAAFIHAFEAGIGSAKAFGFGLLMLRAVGET
ncbi:MAG: type I-E CRISPR-associated protein Cas6/Cse3/CasE, partial [Lentisphaeria bacterium]|nr:type I-E CRISPR-associated protein Cas6/Cse3/CasE [Lentisphaeria bacterium]